MAALLKLGVMGLNGGDGTHGAIDGVGTALGRAGVSGAPRDFDLEVAIALGRADGLKLGGLADHRPIGLEASFDRGPGSDTRLLLVHAGGEVSMDHCRRSNGGLWFANYPEFEEMVARLEVDEKLRNALGANGRDFVRHEYGWPAVLGRFEAALADSGVGGG